MLFLIRKKIHFKINIFGLKLMHEVKILTYRKKVLNIFSSCTRKSAFVIELLQFSHDSDFSTAEITRKWLLFECERMLKLFHYHLRSEHIFWSDNNKDECISVPVNQHDLWEILAYFVMLDNACAKRVIISTYFAIALSRAHSKSSCLLSSRSMDLLKLGNVSILF